jgi:hypothetical protein
MSLAKNSFLLMQILLFFFAEIKTETSTGNSFSIITPIEVSEEIEKINNSKDSEIPYRIGKFGDIPFGKTVLAMIFIEEQNDGSNYWCNYDTTKAPVELTTYASIYKEYLPMILVDQGQCSYSRKALNVQLRGGLSMLIVDDDNDLDNNDKYNVLDLRGNSIQIPSLIIPRNYGDIIKNYIRAQKIKRESQKGSMPEPIIISVRFSAYNPDGTVEMDLFMSSDDVNAIHFFKEFENYKDLLGEKLKFVPVYKYHNFPSYTASNYIDMVQTAPCFAKKEMHFCATNNTDLRIYNPRLVLLENLRQSCIFINYGMDLYWKYMIEFGELCIYLEKPLFNEECSAMALYHVGVDPKNLTRIKACMQDLVDFNSKVDDDYELYNYRKVYEYPMITLNGIKFKGMWLPRPIFNSICTSFIKDEEICGSPQAKQLSKNLQLYPASLIVIVIIFLFFFTILLILCYRRVVYRSVEQTLIEKIQTETIRSIGKYNQVKSNKK